MKLSPIRWINFDVTGTLLTFYPSIGDIYFESARRVQLPLQNLTPNDFKDSFRTAYKRIYKEIPCFGYGIMSERDWWKCVVSATITDVMKKTEHPSNLETSHVERYFRHVYQSFSCPKSYFVYPDTWELLSYLKSSHPSVKLGIITNSPFRTIESTLPVVNLHSHFLTSICCRDHGIMKPDPRIFQLAFQEMQFYDPLLKSPDQVLFVGNHLEYDYYGAKNAGYQSILIDRDGEYHDQTVESQEIVVVKSLIELIPFLPTAE
jgi:REG-2-like HAD superfamily hydrolase